MTVFGNTLSEYIAFQKYLLILTIVAGLIRFGLSLAGTPEGIVRLFSMTALLLLGTVYYPIQVHRRKFGGFKHVWVLLVVQLVVAETISAAGIGIAAVTGVPNTFSTVGPDANYLAHALTHLIGGPTAFGLILWGLASVILVITRKAVPAPAG